ncbi:hypothetical protein [Nonomuraea sp. 10N515B]|uniref:hypothetical protein n=1 Tax=Nonomuraea sp. 10N515B TaxID=3457422 RepID=UPI003FCC8505
MISYDSLRTAARTEGLVVALTLLHGTDGRLEHGPEGHALVPRGLIEAGPTAVLLDTIDLHGRLIDGLRDPGRSGEVSPPWALGLVWLRYGLSEALLESCLDYLGGRTVGGSPLLLQQMVKGQLAEAVVEQLEVLTMLDGARPGDLSQDALASLHQQITRADRRLLRLLGGSSLRADGPGQDAHVSELMADAYTGRTA